MFSVICSLFLDIVCLTLSFYVLTFSTYFNSANMCPKSECQYILNIKPFWTKLSVTIEATDCLGALNLSPNKSYIFYTFFQYRKNLNHVPYFLEMHLLKIKAVSTSSKSNKSFLAWF